MRIGDLKVYAVESLQNELAAYDIRLNTVREEQKKWNEEAARIKDKMDGISQAIDAINKVSNSEHS